MLLAVIALPATAADAPVRILAFGDSLTAGYGLDDLSQAFPAQLEQALRARGHDVKVIASGVSGETTTGGLNRIEWSLAENPDAVIVELGGNDGLRAVDPALTERNLDGILTKLAARGIPALLAGMLAPPNLGRDYGERFAGLYPRLAQKHDAVFYPFFLDGVAAEPSLNQDDRIHPNAAGVKVIVERILPKVEELIARVQARRGGL
ncbi:MAG: arylesterase [Rhodospirillaceae bacterium]|nr:arylesterase [Rhodospirillaceae bacterium]